MHEAPEMKVPSAPMKGLTSGQTAPALSAINDAMTSGMLSSCRYQDHQACKSAQD